MHRKKHNRLTARETCDIVRHIKPLGEVDFSGEIFFRHAVLSLRGVFCAKENQIVTRRRSNNGSEFHEGKENTSAGNFDVASDGNIDGSEFPVKYCGQLFRGQNQ